MFSTPNTLAVILIHIMGFTTSWGTWGFFDSPPNSSFTNYIAIIMFSPQAPFVDPKSPGARAQCKRPPPPPPSFPIHTTHVSVFGPNELAQFVCFQAAAEHGTPAQRTHAAACRTRADTPHHMFLPCSGQKNPGARLPFSPRMLDTRRLASCYTLQTGDLHDGVPCWITLLGSVS